MGWVRENASRITSRTYSLSRKLEMKVRAQERSEGCRKMGVEALRVDPITKREITEK